MNITGVLAELCRTLPCDLLMGVHRVTPEWRSRFVAAANHLNGTLGVLYGDNPPKHLVVMARDLHDCGHVPPPRLRAGELFTMRAVSARLHAVLAQHVVAECAAGSNAGGVVKAA